MLAPTPCPCTNFAPFALFRCLESAARMYEPYFPEAVSFDAEQPEALVVGLNAVAMAAIPESMTVATAPLSPVVRQPPRASAEPKNAVSRASW